MALIEIGDTALPDPSSYTLGLYDIDASTAGRDETGVLHRQRVRKDVLKVTCNWVKLTKTEVETILTAIGAQKQTATFLNLPSISDSRFTYSGDRSITVFQTGSGYRYDLSTTFVEF